MVSISYLHDDSPEVPGIMLRTPEDDAFQGFDLLRIGSNYRCRIPFASCSLPCSLDRFFYRSPARKIEEPSVFPLLRFAPKTKAYSDLEGREGAPLDLLARSSKRPPVFVAVMNANDLIADESSKPNLNGGSPAACPAQKTQAQKNATSKSARST